MGIKFIELKELMQMKSTIIAKDSRLQEEHGIL